MLAAKGKQNKSDALLQQNLAGKWFANDRCLDPPPQAEIAFMKDLVKAAPRCFGKNFQMPTNGLCGWRDPNDLRAYILCAPSGAGEFVTQTSRECKKKDRTRYSTLVAAKAACKRKRRGSCTGVYETNYNKGETRSYFYTCTGTLTPKVDTKTTKDAIKAGLLKAGEFWFRHIAVHRYILPSTSGIKNRIVSVGLVNCGIKKLPKSIGAASEMTLLHLAGNELTDLPSEITKCKKIELLWIERNKFTKIGNYVGQLPELYDFVVSHNFLAKAPDISKLRWLSVFIASDNAIKEIPQSFEDVQSMTTVDLSNNRLDDFPNIEKWFTIITFKTYGNPMKALTIDRLTGVLSSAFVSTGSTLPATVNAPFQHFPLDPQFTFVDPVSPACAFSAIKPTCDLIFKVSDAFRADLKYGGSEMTATVNGVTTVAIDRKDGSYLMSLPMIKALKTVGTHNVLVRLDGVVINPDPFLSSFQNPLPVRATARDCSMNPLARPSNDGSTCVPRTCPPPPAVANAKRIDPPVNEVKSVAFYICKPGYSVKGAGGTDNAQVMCDTKGNWDAAPVCEPFDCKAPSSVANAQVTFDKTTFGGVATVKCDKKYAGGGSAKCGIAGWSALPQCVKSVSCAPGKYTTTINTCVECARGKFQDKQGQKSCTSCAAGKTQTKTGQKACEGCKPGQYATQAYATQGCINCGAGKFQDKQGQTACVMCAAGKTQTQTGQKTCSLCAAGTFSAIEGREMACTACGLGSYNPASGSTACKICPLKSTTKAAGATAFNDCACAAGLTMANGVCKALTLSCSQGQYSIKSCGDSGAAACVAAIPCQLKPEFKAATGGKDLALWGWTCSEDLVCAAVAAGPACCGLLLLPPLTMLFCRCRIASMVRTSGRR